MRKVNIIFITKNGKMLYGYSTLQVYVALVPELSKSVDNWLSKHNEHTKKMN